jgi:CRP-like cAMP-binding protein
MANAKAQAKAGKLRDAAVAATAKGKHKKALGLYQELEAFEPKDGGWSRKVAEMHRQLGKNDLAIEALGRATERYMEMGFLVKAVAMCKMILRIDASHEATQAVLVGLNSERGFTVKPKGTPSKAKPPTPPEPALGHIDVDSAINEISLHMTVPGANHREIAGQPSGVIEIPLDVTAIADAIEEAQPEEAMEDTAPRAALEQTPLFSALSPESLMRLIQQVELVELASGEQLFKQGDLGRTLYVVAEGRINVVTETPERKILGELKDGDFFGEFSMVTEEPRIASIEGLVDSELLAIDRKVMHNLIREEPVVLTVLLSFLRERLIANLVQSSPLFAPFGGAERDGLIERFQFLEVAANTDLITENEVAEALFVVMSGQFSVHRVASEENGIPAGEIATLGPGGLFGEMSLLAHTGAVATVTSKTKCLVLELPASTFREVIMTHPQVLAFVGDLATERERELAAVAGGEQEYEELHLELF